MPTAALTRLDKAVQTVIDIAEQSNWDKLDAVLEELLPDIAAIHSSQYATKLSASDTATVNKLLQKLQTAVNHCLTRKAQIAPLVEALSATKQIANEK
ncbi:MAG: hypothetical protein H6R13_2437 [Proteobacteria bacterium]|nr:hypothetical protein [Pseudomonadota bacterium]